MRKLLNVLWIVLPLLTVSANVIGQTSDSTAIFDYSEPKEYEIGGVKVTGAEFSDDNAIIAIAGFKVGDKIRVPGPETQRALKSLWKLSLFEDVQIYKEKTLGDIIFFEIVVQERPRLSNHSFRGVKKSYHDDLNEKIDRFLVKGGIVTENIKTNASEAIEKYFREKGFLDATVTTEEVKDDRLQNSIRLVFNIARGKKVKIQNITFAGNTNVKAKKLRKQMENTKRKLKLFSTSRYVRTDYETDKNSIVKYYNTIGFRDAKITSDSIWRESDGDLRIHMNVHEGNRY
ncbi:MAG: outer membrane protein assembly factor BamA, partial [Saprospiraceae bacterium]|nr:outer membrane protein assembly factor BamA [Saprospiraceae bacterium]